MEYIELFLSLRKCPNGFIGAGPGGVIRDEVGEWDSKLIYIGIAIAAPSWYQSNEMQG